MKPVPVVATRCLPARLPLVSTVVAVLALDHWHAGDTVRGVVYTLFVFLWAVTIYAMFFGSEQVDIFAERRKP